jgi:hypothetical protein
MKFLETLLCCFRGQTPDDHHIYEEVEPTPEEQIGITAHIKVRKSRPYVVANARLHQPLIEEPGMKLDSLKTTGVTWEELQRSQEGAAVLPVFEDQGQVVRTNFASKSAPAPADVSSPMPSVYSPGI